MIKTLLHNMFFEIDGQGFLSPAEELALEDWLHDMRAHDAAAKRFRSVETVNTHRKHLREKTNQRSAAGVIAYCFGKQYIKIINGEPRFSRISPAAKGLH